MLIQLKMVGTPYRESGKNYSQIDINYLDGKELKAKKIFSFGDNRDIYNTLVNATIGDWFSVEVDESSRWKNWRTLTKTQPPAAGAETGPLKAASTQTNYQRNYETPEERSRKQEIITRQACLNTAVALLSPGAKVPLDVVQVIGIAQELETWVTRTEVPLIQPILDMEDDIPQ